MSQSDVAETLDQSGPAFYRMADVLRITALSRSSLYHRIAAGDFPARCHSAEGRRAGDDRHYRNGLKIQSAIVR